jgi:hypothetical protein
MSAPLFIADGAGLQAERSSESTFAPGSSVWEKVVPFWMSRVR